MIKNKFLSVDCNIKRAALIFLLSKLHFTDDIANTMKLRVTSDEWDGFKGFINDIKSKSQFESIRIIFYHLFTENFFRFTMKTKALALDYGLPDDRADMQADENHDTIFWTDVKRQIEMIEKSDVVELTQLNELREEAIKPFKKLFPEQGLLSEALSDFTTLQTAISNATKSPKPSTKVTRKEMSQACRNYLKASGAGTYVQEVEIEEIEWDSDRALEDAAQATPKKSKGKKRKERGRPKTIKQEPELSSSSDSESERNFKKMNRCMGYSTQNIMKGIGAGTNFSEKLKKCYGDVE